jgi:hypothetical protein
MKTLLPIRTARRRKVLLLASLLVLGSSVSAAAPTGSAPSFAVAKNYATGRAPVSVASGDLNGDGKPEIMTANEGADTISVLHNRGDGSFDAKRDYPTGRRPFGVEIGDLNGDGSPDLVTLNFADVSVLLNRGNGSFEPGTDYPFLGDSLSIADVNGDGKPEIVGSGVRRGSVSALLNRGDGTFEPERDYRVADNPGPVAIGDLNGDSKPDLATASSTESTVSVLLNRGDGSFETRRDYRVGVIPGPVAIGDLNGDGKPDLAVEGVADVSVLLNRGDGTFRAAHHYDICGGFAYGGCHYPHFGSLAIADLNGDGKSDLVTKHFDGNPINPDVAKLEDMVSVLVNKGDGTFAAKHSYRTGFRFVAYPDGEAGDPWLAIVDLNGNGTPDIATRTEDPHVLSVLLNRGDGSFESKLVYRIGRAPSPIAITDLNGDGKPDVVSAHSKAGTVSVRLNTPGLCNVQPVKGKPLAAARRTLARGNCRVGKIRRAYSKTVRRRRVISQKPKFGAVLPNGGKVDVVVSRGRKH